MCLSHSLDEVDHGDGIGRYSMIRPGKIMILGHLKWWSVWFPTLKGNVKENEEHVDSFILIYIGSLQGWSIWFFALGKGVKVIPTYIYVCCT